MPAGSAEFSGILHSLMRKGKSIMPTPYASTSHNPHAADAGVISFNFPAGTPSSVGKQKTWAHASAQNALIDIFRWKPGSDGDGAPPPERLGKKSIDALPPP